MDQLSIDFLTIPQVRATRDAAIEQVAGNAEEWIDEALECIRKLVHTFPAGVRASTDLANKRGFWSSPPGTPPTFRL